MDVDDYLNYYQLRNDSAICTRNYGLSCPYRLYVTLDSYQMWTGSIWRSVKLIFHICVFLCPDRAVRGQINSIFSLSHFQYFYPGIRLECMCKNVESRDKCSEMFYVWDVPTRMREVHGINTLPRESGSLQCVVLRVGCVTANLRLRQTAVASNALTGCQSWLVQLQGVTTYNTFIINCMKKKIYTMTQM